MTRNTNYHLLGRCEFQTSDSATPLESSSLSPDQLARAVHAIQYLSPLGLSIPMQISLEQAVVVHLMEEVGMATLVLLQWEPQ